MINCPTCGTTLRQQTIVDASHEPPKETADGPLAICTFPLFVNHNPRRSHPCGKRAVIVDALFPVEWSGNRCQEHLEPEPAIFFDI